MHGPEIYYGGMRLASLLRACDMHFSQFILIFRINLHWTLLDSLAPWWPNQTVANTVTLNAPRHDHRQTTVHAATPHCPQ